MLTKILACELAGTLPLWAKVVAPIVEEVAGILGTTRLPTELTKRNPSRTGRDFAKIGTLQAASGVVRPQRSCLQSGKPVPRHRRFRCSERYEIYHREVLFPRLAAARPVALGGMRAAGVDPAHGERCGGQARKGLPQVGARAQGVGGGQPSD
jgi:hypothetical protein